LRRKTGSGRGVERKKEKAGKLGLGEKKKKSKLPDCQKEETESARKHNGLFVQSVKAKIIPMNQLGMKESRIRITSSIS
jgi:hypothetical protein